MLLAIRMIAQFLGSRTSTGMGGRRALVMVVDHREERSGRCVRRGRGGEEGARANMHVLDHV